MARLSSSNLSLILIFLVITISSPVSAQLSESFYGNTCPSMFETVRSAVRSAINREARMGATIIRVFFHDCFINGCDGGNLLDGGEKGAAANRDIPPRVFDVIDNIKTQVDQACGGNVVSCADILAVAARDSVAELGGRSYSIPVGRRDARTANLDGATNDLPAFFDTLQVITRKFADKGFTAREMVALSGAHTVGQARCATFRDRIYRDTNIDAAFATSLQANCPDTTNGDGDNNLAPLDPQSPNRFGNNYFQALINQRGLLNSDQVLFNGGETDAFVTTYSNNANSFSTDFANAMIKMGNRNPLTGTQGEIRANCRRAN